LDFGKILYGAHIRFNIILHEKNAVDCDKYKIDWEDWCARKENFNWDSFNLEKLFALTNPNEDTRVFVTRWIEFVKDNDHIDIELIDRLIENREYRLKGSRSKIKNYSKVNIDNWVGLKYLTYRWVNVKRILEDIYEGVSKDV
jgi:hypothetical protein